MQDLGSTFLACVEREPQRLAIVDGDQRLTYAQWQDCILAIVAAFNELGLVKGDHIVGMLQNRFEAATLHWACQLTGLIITPVNWRALPEEVDYAIGNAEAKALVYEQSTAEAATGAKLAKDIIRIAVDIDSRATHQFETLLKTTPAIPESRSSADDTSVMLYTSGTTGQGKGVPRTHRAERTAAVAHVAQNQYQRNETTLGVMPLYHTMGVRSMLSMCLINGTFICQPRFDASEALKLIESERISNLYLVPTLYHDLLGAYQKHKTDISSVRKLGYAGAAMTDGLLIRIQELFQPDLFVNHYGSSEIYTFTIEPDAIGKPGSAGKAGLNQRIRVVALNSDDPTDVAGMNEEGQIIASLNSEEAFHGYWRRPDADQKSIRSGWYFTGDIGYFDGDGDLFVTGRVDDMIISGGENILPAEIESVLSLHEAVSEVAVVGLPDERLGHKVSAFVSRNKAVSEEQLDTWCLQSELAPFKRPRDYFFLSEIPKSPVGKLLRRKLVAGEYELENNVKEIYR